MEDRTKYPWQKAVVDAFLAPPADLAGKISIAEHAILARLKELQRIDAAEHIALHDALRSLRVLITEIKSRNPGSDAGDKCCN